MHQKEGILREQLEQMKRKSWLDAFEEKKNRDERLTRMKKGST
jgi:hypothetical protein